MSATGAIVFMLGDGSCAKASSIRWRSQMADGLHLVKVPLRTEKLVAVGRAYGAPLRDVDEGYLVHCLLRELWQEHGPAPFVLRGRGRILEVWGYGRRSAAELIEHARSFGDPSLVAAIDLLGEIASRPVPRFEAGQRLGFALRACPVARLAAAKHGHDRGAEVDVFLARCYSVGSEVVVSREEVYSEWLRQRIAKAETTGVTLASARVVGMSRARLLRRTQEINRRSQRLERPDVRFAGELVVVDGDRLCEWLGHGVGRHRAFGFGAVMLVPPQLV
jgi:CRISPR system Cascade subunit CasE